MQIQWYLVQRKILYVSYAESCGSGNSVTMPLWYLKPGSTDIHPTPFSHSFDHSLSSSSRGRVIRRVLKQWKRLKLVSGQMLLNWAYSITEHNSCCRHCWMLLLVGCSGDCGVVLRWWLWRLLSGFCASIQITRYGLCSNWVLFNVLLVSFLLVSSAIHLFSRLNPELLPWSQGSSIFLVGVVCQCFSSVRFLQSRCGHRWRPLFATGWIN
jgi:hypothetical protein